MTDKFLDLFMSDGEYVKYELVDNRGGRWLATNKRIIEIRDGFGNKMFRDLDYRHIVSIKLEIRKYPWQILLGFVGLAVGFMIRFVIGGGIEDVLGEIIDFIFAIFLIVSMIVIMSGLLSAKISCRFYTENAQFEIYARKDDLIKFMCTIRKYSWLGY